VPRSILILSAFQTTTWLSLTSRIPCVRYFYTLSGATLSPLLTRRTRHLRINLTLSDRHLHTTRDHLFHLPRDALPRVPPTPKSSSSSSSASERAQNSPNGDAIRIVPVTHLSRGNFTNVTTKTIPSQRKNQKQDFDWSFFSSISHIYLHDSIFRYSFKIYSTIFS
jgi:hypothetical protein